MTATCGLPMLDVKFDMTLTLDRRARATPLCLSSTHLCLFSEPLALHDRVVQLRVRI